MDYLYLIIPALALAGVGVRIMFCGHRHQVRHDRRRGDVKVAR